MNKKTDTLLLNKRQKVNTEKLNTEKILQKIGEYTKIQNFLRFSLEMSNSEFEADSLLWQTYGQNGSCN